MSLDGEEILIKEEPLVDAWEEQDEAKDEDTNVEFSSNGKLAATSEEDNADERILPGSRIGKLSKRVMLDSIKMNRFISFTTLQHLLLSGMLCKLLAFCQAFLEVILLLDIWKKWM